MKIYPAEKWVSSPLSGKFNSAAEKVNARYDLIFLVEDHTEFAVLIPLALLYNLG